MNFQKALGNWYELVEMAVKAMTRSEGTCPLLIDVIDCGSLNYQLDLSYQKRWLDKDIKAFVKAWESTRALLLPQCRRNVTIEYNVHTL